MSLSLQDWVRNGWLIDHKSSRDEIQNLLAIADRDPATSQVKDLPADWSLAIAYNAALQSATAALAAAGYRAARDSHHYRVIESLEFTVQSDPKLIRQFDAFRKKRNISSYEVGGAVSDREAQEMRALAVALRAQVEAWICKTHPQFL